MYIYMYINISIYIQFLVSMPTWALAYQDSSTHVQICIYICVQYICISYIMSSLHTYIIYGYMKHIIHFIYISNLYEFNIYRYTYKTYIQYTQHTCIANLKGPSYLGTGISMYVHANIYIYIYIHLCIYYPIIHDGTSTALFPISQPLQTPSMLLLQI